MRPDSRSWYVQNVSTFPNTFAIVLPLICVFWMQLTRTNAVFSRIALVSCFCAEIQLSGKIPENTPIFIHPKTHGARRWDEEVPQRALTRPRPGRAWPRWGRLRLRLDFPFGLLMPRDLKTSGGSTIFQKEFRFAATERNPYSATRNSVLAPCRDGELEEIIAIIIITDASPSTIHDSPIHVWVIPPL